MFMNCSLIVFICTCTESFNPNLFGVIKQIYHVMEGYLRKIPVLGQNFPRLAAREISQSLDWYFSQIPLHNMIYLFNIILQLIPVKLMYPLTSFQV